MKDQFLKFISELFDKAEAYDRRNTQGAQDCTQNTAQPETIVSLTEIAQQRGYALHTAIERLTVKLGSVLPPQNPETVMGQNQVARPTLGSPLALQLEGIIDCTADAEARLLALIDKIQLP